MFLVDSHCHLDMLDLTSDQGDMDRVVTRAKENGVHYLLNVSVSMAEFPTILKTATHYDSVGASVGLHPNASTEEVDFDTLVRLGQHPKVVAVGETGLDYFRTESETEWQKERFRCHIAAAKRLQKPLIIHTRNAKEDTLRIMREEDAAVAGGVMHCFSEDLTVAMEALALGFYISFSGIVTFKNAEITQEVARKIPLDRILLETDSPYLAPNPKRGKPNEPAYVRYTAEYLAALRGITLAELAEQTTHNFFSLFKGAVKPHV